MLAPVVIPFNSTQGDTMTERSADQIEIVEGRIGSGDWYFIGFWVFAALFIVLVLVSAHDDSGVPILIASAFGSLAGACFVFGFFVNHFRMLEERLIDIQKATIESARSASAESMPSNAPSN